MSNRTSLLCARGVKVLQHKRLVLGNSAGHIVTSVLTRSAQASAKLISLEACGGVPVPLPSAREASLKLHLGRASLSRDTRTTSDPCGWCLSSLCCGNFHHPLIFGDASPAKVPTLVDNAILPAAATRRNGVVVQHPMFQGSVLAIFDGGGCFRGFPFTAAEALGRSGPAGAL